MNVFQLERELNNINTPEDALLLLESLPKPDSYRKCLVYVKFIRARHYDKQMVGIWEELLLKSLKLYIGDKPFGIFGEQGGLGVKLWLGTILSSKNLCPNPYTKLELFRLARLYEMQNFSYQIFSVFVDTISKIKPYRFYPSGNSDDILFGAVDFTFFLVKGVKSTHIKDIIYDDINLQRGNRVEIVKCDFLLNCIYLLAVFAGTARSNTNDHATRTEILEHCCAAFLEGVCYSVSYVYDIINQQPYFHHVMEFMRNISIGLSTIECPAKCVAKVNRFRNQYVSIPQRKGRHLPKLLMNREVHGSKYMQQNYLLDSVIKYQMALKQPFSMIERILDFEKNVLLKNKSIRRNQMESTDSEDSLDSEHEESEEFEELEEDTSSEDYTSNEEYTSNEDYDSSENDY